MITEQCLEEGGKPFAAIIDSDNAYDDADRKSLWDVREIQCVGEQELEGRRSVSMNASAHVHVKRRLNQLCSRVDVKKK